jgi:tRNA pseudouridine38-40 synthase
LATIVRNIALTISYDGTDFNGWQTQPGYRTVQETLEKVLADFTGETFVRAVNARLPPDVVVRDAREVDQSFDANKDAKRKLYRYVIHDGPVPSPFLRRYAYHVRRRLDAAAMRRASRCLIGRHDFHSFETDWPNRLSSIRTVTHLGVSRAGEYIWIDVEADGFLYNMVRSIAGTLIDVGRGHIPEGRVEEVLNAEDRRLAGPTAPPQGLFLMRVTYA